MERFGKEGIVERLSQLDGDLLALYPDKAPFDMIIVGGSAIVLRDLAPEKTQTVDIDALRTADEVESLLYRYDINTHVDTFRFKFPSGYAERLVKTSFQGDMLRVFTLSNEDLAITKMLAWRDQDRDDVEGMLAAGNVDLLKLRAIAGDVTELQLNLEEHEWEAFRERLREVEAHAENAAEDRLAAPAKDGPANTPNTPSDGAL